jgi:enoyl-CoA hydratase/carnithine racemase
MSNITEQVTTETSGNILKITVDREEKRNAMTPKMFKQLAAAYQELEDNDDSWVGVPVPPEY